MTTLSSEGGVMVDGILHPVEYAARIAPTEEYVIRPFTFLDQLGQESDGCVFEIRAGGSTRVVEITDVNYTSQKIASAGNGFFLGLSPDGDVVVHEVGENTEQNPLIPVGAGWVECWIASDKTGLTVEDVSTPAFDPSFEVPVVRTFKEEFLSGLHRFWRAYDQLKYQDGWFRLDRDNYHDLWDLEGLSPGNRVRLVTNRLRDEEVRLYFPAAYQKFVVEGPRRASLGTYKTNELNSGDYWRWQTKHAKTNRSSRPDRLLTPSDVLRDMAIALVKSDESFSESTFRQFISDHLTSQAPTL